MAFQKKATPITEGILGAAAAQLQSSVSTLNAGIEKIAELVQTSEGLAIKIAAQEDKLSELDLALKNRVAQHSVEFDLKVKEDESALVQKVLGSQHLVAVPKAELEAMQQELKDYASTLDKKVAERVGAATGAIAKDFKHKEELLTIQHQANTAEKDGKIASLTSEVTVLRDQLKISQDQLSSEREAGIKRAQAGSIGTINLGDSSGNKR